MRFCGARELVSLSDPSFSNETKRSLGFSRHYVLLLQVPCYIPSVSGHHFCHLPAHITLVSPLLFPLLRIHRFPPLPHTPTHRECTQLFHRDLFVDQVVVWWPNFPNGLTNDSTTFCNSITLSPHSFLLLEKFDSGSKGLESKRSAEWNQIKSLEHLQCQCWTAICPSFESTVTVCHT